MMLFELQGLNHYYGTHHALRAVSVRVNVGSVGLLGPNGSGKTTLIKVLLNLLEPESGSGKVLDHDIANRAVEIRQRIGYMPETETFFGEMTGFDAVVYAARLSGLPRRHAIRRAHEVLDYAGIDEARYRDVGGYSTGMKQRVKLAQALVHGPEVVFLDEPTNGLDPEGREDMLKIIRDLRDIPVSVLLSSHLLNDVERVCDHVLVLHQGEMRHYGPLSVFTAGQAGTYEVEVRESGPRLCEALASRGKVITRNPEGHVDRFVIELGPGDLDAFWRTAIELGIQVRHLKPVRFSLEGAFVRLLEGDS